MSDIGDGNVVITQATFDKLCRIADMSKADEAADNPPGNGGQSAELRKLLSGVPLAAADAAILAACRKGLTAHAFFNRR